MTARKGASDYFWLKDLKENPEMLKPPEIIIPRLMWRGARVCLFGREKSGKSTLLTYAVAQASNGLTFLDEQCQQATFVWCALEEMISETVRRFEKFGGDGSRIAIVDSLAGNWLETLGRTIDKTKADGVIVDTMGLLLSKSGIKDENQAGEINASFIPKLTQLTREKNVGLLLNGHSNKSEGEPRGSTALTAGMDVNLVMRAPDKNHRPKRVLTFEGRWGAGEFAIEFVQGETESFQLTEGELSLSGKILRYIQSNPDSSKNAVLEGVEGGTKPKRDAITDLLRAGKIQDLGTQAASKFRVVETTRSTGNSTTGGTPEKPRSTGTVPGSSTAAVLDSGPLEPEAGPPRYGPFEEAHYERR